MAQQADLVSTLPRGNIYVVNLWLPLRDEYVLAMLIPVVDRLLLPVALDKCQGVRPIGIGETARRIIGRAIARVLSDDIQMAAGPL